MAWAFRPARAGHGARPKAAACRPLAAAEIAAAAAELQPRDAGMFRLGLATGFRVSALLALTLGCARGALAAGRVYLRAAAMKGGRRGHSVALRPEARAALEALLAGREREGDEAPLFRSRKGGAIRRAAAQRALRRAFEAAGLAGLEVPGLLGTHSMRKTAAARIYAAATRRMIATGGAAGEAIDLTRRALGHRDLASTLAYLPVDVRDVDAAVLA